MLAPAGGHGRRPRVDCLSQGSSRPQAARGSSHRCHWDARGRPRKARRGRDRDSGTADSPLRPQTSTKVLEGKAKNCSLVPRCCSFGDLNVPPAQKQNVTRTPGRPAAQCAHVSGIRTAGLEPGVLRQVLRGVHTSLRGRGTVEPASHRGAGGDRLGRAAARQIRMQGRECPPPSGQHPRRRGAATVCARLAPLAQRRTDGATSRERMGAPR